VTAPGRPKADTSAVHKSFLRIRAPLSIKTPLANRFAAKVLLSFSCLSGLSAGWASRQTGYFAISGTNFVHLTYSITDKRKQGAPVANGQKKSKRLFYILGAVAVVVMIVFGLVAATPTGT
jgi:hypothetical protein